MQPFREREVGSIVLDHVVKNVDNRGRFAIGSERKLGVVDVSLGFETKRPISRGRNGLVVVTVNKDRFGYLPRPRAMEIELRSDPATHRIEWEFRTAAETTVSQWQPTVLMERVSRYLEQAGEVSRTEIEKNVTGQSEYVRQAIDALVSDGYAVEQPGPRKGRMNRSLKPYREATTPSDPVATPFDGLPVTPSDPVSPLQGDGDEDGDAIERLADLAREAAA